MKISKTAHDRFLAVASRRRLYEQERLLVEATELLCETMEKKGISRAQLARRLGKSKAYITQILRGNQNMTLRTLADISDVLDVRISLKAVPREQNEPATSDSVSTRQGACYEFQQYGSIRVSDSDPAIVPSNMSAGKLPPQVATGYPLSIPA